MAVQISSGRVIFRAWEGQGLSETESTFSSLEELFGLCLQVEDTPLVDRIIIEGTDNSGKNRRLVLSFQSVTDGSGDQMIRPI